MSDKFSIEDVQDCDCGYHEYNPSCEGIYDPKHCYFCVIPSKSEDDNDFEVIISTKYGFDTEGYVDDSLDDCSFKCDLGLENTYESTWACNEDEREEVIERLQKLGFEYSKKMEKFCLSWS